MIPLAFSSEAISYTWRQLAQRAGISFSKNAVNGFEDLGLSIYYKYPDQAGILSPGLVVCRCDDSNWEAILAAPENSMHWKTASETIPAETSLPFDNPVPILFWGKGYESGNKPFAERRADGSVIFFADILASSFFMLSRWEETVVPARDAHERFPAIASVAHRQGFLHLPVVDQYAFILRAWLQVLLPDWKPVRNIFSIKLSHDIDHVRRFNDTGEFLLKLGGDMLNRHSLRKALETASIGISEWIRPTASPEYEGITDLADISRRNGLKSAFYFKASKRSRFDSGYHPEWRWVKALITDLRDQGFEIGFHPGYQTFSDRVAFMREKYRFERAFGINQYGGRQHYLRFKVPDTWRIWEQAGLIYDTSMLYPDLNGFRCGTCHPFLPFDIEQNRCLGIMEYPLVVMDVTLKKNAVSLQEAYGEVLILARRCKEVEGIFSLLWHNISRQGEWMPWYRIYEALIPELVAMTERSDDLGR